MFHVVPHLIPPSASNNIQSEIQAKPPPHCFLIEGDDDDDDDRYCDGDNDDDDDYDDDGDDDDVKPSTMLTKFVSISTLACLGAGPGSGWREEVSHYATKL